MSKEIEAHILEIYHPTSYLGSGAYGHVWKATHLSSGKEYALKKIFDAFQNDVDAQRTYREITILPQLDHDNIVKLHEVIRARNGRDIYLVFEFMETDLHSVLGYFMGYSEKKYCRRRIFASSHTNSAKCSSSCIQHRWYTGTWNLATYSSTPHAKVHIL